MASLLIFVKCLHIFVKTAKSLVKVLLVFFMQKCQKHSINSLREYVLLQSFQSVITLVMQFILGVKLPKYYDVAVSLKIFSKFCYSYIELTLCQFLYRIASYQVYLPKEQFEYSHFSENLLPL